LAIAPLYHCIMPLHYCATVSLHHCHYITK
jgi:hypothetical protein